MRIPYFILASLLVVSQVSLAAANPFKSKDEEIEFLSKVESPDISIFKTDEFFGIVNRANEKGRLRNADVYSFKDEGKIKIDKALCEKYLVRIIGPLDKITMKVKKTELFKTATGDVCEVQVVDEQKADHIIPERRILIGFINAKPYGLVFNLKAKADTATEENIRKFWQGLR